MGTGRSFDVIIIGGSYSGLAAGMGLGRALRNVLIIDSSLPANRFTPESHNFLTHDGQSPASIAEFARKEVDEYKSVRRLEGEVIGAERVGTNFRITLSSGENFHASRLIFATGIVDIMPAIPGVEDCWGKSVLHCPYCHGYEVRQEQTGILGNGDYAFEFASLISNWTAQLTVFTNGASTLTLEQIAKLESHKIQIVETHIDRLQHNSGYIERIVFHNGQAANVKAIYARPEFKQHCNLPNLLGCELTSDGYIKIDPVQRTTVPGIYACGDNVTRIRTVANAISMGTTTAITLNKDMIQQSF